MIAQFSAYKNKNPKTRTAYPFLVDVQADLLRDLRTRVVVPLVKLTAVGKKPIKNLTPVLEVDGLVTKRELRDPCSRPPAK